MPFKPNRITVSTARRAANDSGATYCVVLAFGEDGRIAGASYGTDADRCHEAARFLDGLVDLLERNKLSSPRDY